MRLNLVLVALLAVVQVVQLFIVPAMLLPRSAAWGALLVPVALLTLTLWALIHEAMHGVLVPQAGANQLLGRALGVLFGAPFRVVRVGHLLHHKFNRQPPDSTEVFDERRSSWLAAAPGFYATLLGGLYAFEVLANLLCWLPATALRGVARRVASEHNIVGRLVDALTTPSALREIRLDALGIAVVWGASFWLYGAHGWMLALALLARGVIISMHDNVYHYGTALAASPTTEAGAATLYLPRWASSLILHFNYHHTHHEHPRLGWRDLPRRFEHDGGRYAGAWLPALLRQLRGPLPRASLPVIATPARLQRRA